MNDDARGEREGDAVGNGVGCGEVQRGVVVECFDIEGVVRPQNARDVVRVAKTVVGYVGENGEVGEVPDLQGTEERFIDVSK